VTPGQPICGTRPTNDAPRRAGLQPTARRATRSLLFAMGVNWAFKVMVEIVMTPVTKRKRAEGIDHYGRDTRCTTFSFDT
jgi:hypothetical protein